MNVSYYCQHVLGIGHFHRSVEICRAIARSHKTTLILGGPPVEFSDPEIQLFNLPGLKMNNEFDTLIPCSNELSLEEVKASRKNLLFKHFRENRPDIFITELYPFGRRAFRFELEPLLGSIHDSSLPHCSCYCSVRDILVEKPTGREKFEQGAVQTLNSYFDAVFVHADPNIITLNETFSLVDHIRIPLRYTGFVTKPEPTQSEETIRKDLGLSRADKLIVASIGGGNVGGELLHCVVRAFTLLADSIPAHLQLFSGPYCDDRTYQALQDTTRENITVERFTDNFPLWLKAADLSISMAGYNSCMNLVQAGIPALVYPFQQNREQRLRAERLGKRIPIAVLEDSDLSPKTLARKIIDQLNIARFASDININGAEETARLLIN